MSQVLELHDTAIQIFSKLSEGNPGAMSVMMQIMNKKGPMEMFPIALSLDAMGVRGCKIWVGFKDYCNQDLDKFCELVLNRDQALLDAIEKEMGRQLND